MNKLLSSTTAEPREAACARYQKALAEKRAFELLVNICEARGFTVTIKERELHNNAAGSMIFDERITIGGELNTEQRLDVLLDLLAKRELDGAGKCYHSINNEKANPFARLAKRILLELPDGAAQLHSEGGEKK